MQLRPQPSRDNRTGSQKTKSRSTDRPLPGACLCRLSIHFLMQILDYLRLFHSAILKIKWELVCVNPLKITNRSVDACDRMLSKSSLTVITRQNGKDKASQRAWRAFQKPSWFSKAIPRVSTQSPGELNDAVIVNYSGGNGVVPAYCLWLRVTTLLGGLITIHFSHTGKPGFRELSNITQR